MDEILWMFKLVLTALIVVGGVTCGLGFVFTIRELFKIKKEKKMSRILDKFPMGAKARDVVSGFEGIISSKTEWLTGCDQVGIRPIELDKDGATRKAEWFDVTQVEVVAQPSPQLQRIVDGKLQGEAKQETKKLSGGPQDTPRLQRG
jgi:hypothetical protein